MKRLWELVSASPANIAAAVFLLIVFSLPQPGGDNKDVRLATMAALTVDHTFAITNYHWSNDWAQSPTNHQIYANKPPGPAIIGAPIYFLVDHLVIHEPLNRNQQRYADRGLYNHFISIVIQALPFALIVCWAAVWLKKEQASKSAVQFASWAMLFGTTASLFMNSYFGHGLAALCVLAATLCFLQRSYTWSAFFLGWAALSDYGAVLLLIPFLVVIFMQERNSWRRALKSVALGAALPLFMWISFHWSIFGHPLALASRFSNPHFLSSAVNYPTWGLFSRLPDFHVMVELLFGPSQGILFTQPWLLVMLFVAGTILMSKQRINRNLLSLVWFAAGGFILLWLGNSIFNGWGAGATPGPRYLSTILPVFGLVAGKTYDTFPYWLRVLLWGCLAYTIFFFVIVYSTTILALPGMPLWQFYLPLFTRTSSIKPLLHVVSTIIVLMVAGYVEWRTTIKHSR